MISVALAAVPFRDDDDDSHVVAVVEFSRSIAIISIFVMIVNGIYGGAGLNIVRRPGTRGASIRRVRRLVSNIMYELGGYSRRYYRMSDTSFWILHNMLKPSLEKLLEPKLHRPRKKRRKRNAPNGLISTSIRLSIALRYFAGGDPLDLAFVRGVSHSEVFNSVWMVVDAAHHTPALDIVFPESHADQHQLARDF